MNSELIQARAKFIVDIAHSKNASSYGIYKYRTRGAAQSALNHCNKPAMLILGDDEYFWMVSMAYGNALLKAGFESAR